ncbi:cadherin repeat domain-containing protein, partial [bacterium]|nr:cadherin repeat domain-containing protein [bacterium]
ETEHYGPFYIDTTIPSDPIQITSSPVTTAIEDETYIYTLATNSADVTYILIAPYPSGMTIDSNGEISYDPSFDAEADAYTLTVKATDKWGREAIQTFTLTVASVNDAPYFTTTLPGIDTCDTLAMPGRAYTFVIEAEDEETQGENLVYTLKGTPPAGMSIDPLDAGYFGARIRWVPGDADAGRTIPLEIEVSDGENTATLSYDLRVLDPLVITPDRQTLLRINGENINKDFIISGGFFDVSTPYYSCELIDSDTGDITTATTDDYDVDENGVFYYKFSTVDRTGSYRLRVTDAKGFTTISGPIEIWDITAVPMDIDPTGNIDVPGNEAALTVTDTETVYNGATVVVPAGSSTDPFTFTFNRVTDGQPYTSMATAFGDVIEMKAEAEGEEITFTKTVEVTLPYGSISNIDRPQDLRVYTFNSDLSRWVPVPDYTVNTGNETISFRTTHFSLFTVGQPEELGTPVIGGTDTKDYSMISFPCNPDNPDLAANLAEVLGSYNTTIWRCAAYNNSSMGYDEANASGFADMHPLEPGRAYWIISRYNNSPKVKGLTLDKVVPFETTLHPGWNMIANPYNEIINSNTITVSDDGVNFDSLSTTGLTDNYIFKFNPHDDGHGNTIWYTKI